MPLFDCLGSRRHGVRGSGEREPLLPEHHRHNDTLRQQRLHRKLHSYQMLRALTKGFMPSSDQLVVQLRTVLASDALNPADAALSESGRLLLKHVRACVSHLVDLVLEKNRDNQLQNFIWCLAKSHLLHDLPRPSRQTLVHAHADATATARSVKTLSSLLLTNSDFRLFLSDVQTVGRQIFRDVAFSASSAAENVAHDVDPSQGEADPTALQRVDGQVAPSPAGIGQSAAAVEASVKDAGKQISSTARQSAKAHLEGSERETLVQRLQAAALKLRQRPDYTQSVSTLALVLRQYALAYVSASETAVSAATGRVQQDPAINVAVGSLMGFLTTFGRPEAWRDLAEQWHTVLRHLRNDPEFEQTIDKSALALEKMFTDPATLSAKGADLSDLRRAFLENRSDPGTLEADVDALLAQTRVVGLSVMEDEHLTRLMRSATRLWHVLSPDSSVLNRDLTGDLLNVMIPLLVQAVQHIPIPRLEVSTPDIDLLLENLVFEPGVTINSSSFLPFRFRVETYNDVEIRKARMGTVSRTTSLATVKIEGLSLRAEDVGFWLRAHSGWIRFADEGIASFELDERGMDINLDIEIAKEPLENMLALKAVRVRIHKLSYTLRKSKLSCLAWLFKPIIRFVVRKTVERQVASAIADFFHAANREIVFMRERLRATRIAQPEDLATFFKAVLARLTPEDNPDVYLRIGVNQADRGVFRGVYAPGSMVKTWVEEGLRASEVVDDYEKSGWKNDIFDALPQV